MNRSALSIRMEGGLERLPELGERYAQAARLLRAVSAASFAIVCSRVEGLIAEDAIFLRLLETAERLRDHGTAHDHRTLAHARSQRDELVAVLGESSPAAELSPEQRWPLAKERLRLRLRLQAARAEFVRLPFGTAKLSHLVAASLPTVAAALVMVATGALQVWPLLVVSCISVIAWSVSKVDAVTSCPYCPGSPGRVDWFDDALAVRAELLKPYSNPWQLRCVGCGMALTNLDRAIAALKNSELAVAPPDAPTRRSRTAKPWWATR